MASIRLVFSVTYMISVGYRLREGRILKKKLYIKKEDCIFWNFCPKNKKEVNYYANFTSLTF